MDKNEKLKAIPSVDKLLSTNEAKSLVDSYGKDMVTDSVRESIESVRQKILAGINSGNNPESMAAWMELAKDTIEKLHSRSVKKIVNCTGIIIHTNLGRAIMAEEAAKAAYEAATNNINLEYNLEKGNRGDRDDLVEELLIKLTGCEAATVVNNNAAAVLLCLNSLSDGEKTAVSRGELIEIGGSFRLPDIMAKSGAILLEIGTTNRTHLSDYENALADGAKLIMRAHTSNYHVVGFTAAPTTKQLAELSKKSKTPLMVDLGSGSLVEVANEPTVQTTLKEGAGLVTISGDKLLGGPQAGIIFGRADLVSKVKKNHLKRALRTDKMTLAALEATLHIYLNSDEAFKKIPSLRQLHRDIEDIRAIANNVAKGLSNYFGAEAEVKVINDVAKVGSGSAPEVDIPSLSVAIRHDSKNPDRLAAWFRSLEPPIVGRIEGDLYRLDIRSIESADEILESLPL